MHAVPLQPAVGIPAGDAAEQGRAADGQRAAGDRLSAATVPQQRLHDRSIGKVYHYNNDDPDGWVRRYTETFVAEGQWCDGYCSGYQLPANRALVENYLRGKRLRDGLPASAISEITDTPDEKTPDGIIAQRAIEELRKFKQSGVRRSSSRPASTARTCR